MSNRNERDQASQLPHAAYGGVPSEGGSFQHFNGNVFALDFSLWKRPIVTRFLQNATVRFVNSADEVPAHATLFVWGARAISGNLAQGVNVIRIEDGFIRSVGLGADLVSPVSWVADQRGIYFDSRTPSDLEHWLNTFTFPQTLTERAALLRQDIVNTGVTKYNVGQGRWTRPDSAPRVILVPGQVEDDASISCGAPGISQNLSLLKAVRSAHPDAYLVYKPHPDVLAGLRKRGVMESSAKHCCDEIVIDTPMQSLLEQVDEVHLMTSLTGFEALLRGVEVTCYGQPFYAGWGLTTDIEPTPRRQRQRTLDELVAAALILYPTYISQVTGRYSTPENVLDELNDIRSTKRHQRPGLALRLKRKILSTLAASRRR